MTHARPGRMPIRDFRSLVCWQLSNELKCEIFEFTSRDPAARDFKFRDQIRDSSKSATRNIAEGFGRFGPAEFAQYLSWARASLMETRNHLIDARECRYISDALFSRLFNLAFAALRLTTNLMRARTTPGGRRAKVPKIPTA